MTSENRPKQVLAIYFQAAGFAFAVLSDGHEPLVAWGVPEFRGANTEARCLKRIESLLLLHTPDVLVLQDTSQRNTRRASRIQELNRETVGLAKDLGVRVSTYARTRVQDYFKDLGADTKQRMAEIIAKHLPALELYVPPPRKPWKSQDPRMGIFEAAALAWMFFRGTDSDQRAS
jgi:hypothetical protein